MSKRKYIAGDIAYISSGHQVKILDTKIPGIYSIKVQRLDNQHILYLKPEDLAKRRAQALKKELCLPVSEEIKEAAEIAAERKIKEFLERKKKMENEKRLTYNEAKSYFYALYDFEGKNDQSDSAKTIVSLAEETLYNLIKNGVLEG